MTHSFIKDRGGRQLDPHPDPPSGPPIFHAYPSVVLFNQIFRDGQPETGRARGPAGRLRTREPLQDFLGNAASGVFDGDLHKILENVPLVQGTLLMDPQSQRAPAGHGLKGVQDQVINGLSQVRRAPKDPAVGRVRVDAESHIDGLPAQLVLEQVRRLFQDLARVQRFQVQCLPRCEVFQVRRDHSAALGVPLDDAGFFFELPAPGDQHLGHADDACERVVELLRHALGQLPQGGHPFRAGPLLFHLPGQFLFLFFQVVHKDGRKECGHPK
ncbi:MAG: hypothetical protein A3A86_06780 [Elusimicrobia bacterium RIFCSPLOWO2_01_FULL_60_11]|nr:MAG: hypothetical protein A3A86_06780 [Elusimicrobia bacterium RIFCSPLOWO2_01_FULL_60_11]